MLVLAYVWVPFVALPIFVSLDNLDISLLEAASDLGASRLRTFWRITLPLSIPGVIAAFVFVFVPTIGEFVTPLLVGGPSGYMYGNAIQDVFTRARTGRPGRSWRCSCWSSSRGSWRCSAATSAFGRGRLMDAAASTGARRLLRIFYALLVVFLYAPILVLALFSFNDGDLTFPLQGFTTQWYGKFFANPLLLEALKRSAIVATVSSCVAVVLGILASYRPGRGDATAGRRRRRRSCSRRS